MEKIAKSFVKFVFGRAEINKALFYDILEFIRGYKKKTKYEKGRKQ